MKKFCAKVAIFLIPFAVLQIACIVAFTYFPVRFFDGEYAMYQQNKDYTQNNHEYNRVVILGDSTAKCGYKPKLLAEDVYNISFGGASPVESYFYFREYLEAHDAPEYAFISYVPPHFMYSDTLWTRSVYFHRISDTDLNELLRDAERFNDSEIIGDGPVLLERLKYKTYFFSAYGKPLLESFGSGCYQYNITSYKNSQSDRGYHQFGTADRCDDFSTLEDLDSFSPNQTQDYYFEKLLELCTKNEIKVIVETLPLNDATFKACSPLYLQQYAEYMSDIQEKYPEITVNIERMHWSSEYYGDANHLNTRGTQKFADYLLEKYSYVFNAP